MPGERGPRAQYGSAGFPYEGGRLHLLPSVRDEHCLTASFQLPAWMGSTGGCQSSRGALGPLAG